MRLRLGRPRGALIVAPHPDDEVIAAAGLIRALMRRGTRVRVAIVADGGASHPGSRRWPRARLVAERRRESRRALRRLGLPAGAIAFLDLPDGALATTAGRCRRAIARAVACAHGLDLIVGPSREDAHPDHRAVAVAIAGLRTRARTLTYRVWPPGAADKGARTIPFPGGAAAKRSLIRCYRTQTGAIRDDRNGFAIARHELDGFARPLERFRETAR